MDCEYVLICKCGDTVIENQFHAATPEEAEERANQVVLTYQSQNVRNLPFAPEIVEAQLYRGFKEISGAKFVKTTNGRPYIDPSPKTTQTQG